MSRIDSTQAQFIQSYPCQKCSNYHSDYAICLCYVPCDFEIYQCVLFLRPKTNEPNSVEYPDQFSTPCPYMMQYANHQISEEACACKCSCCEICSKSASARTSADLRRTISSTNTKQLSAKRAASSTTSNKVLRNLSCASLQTVDATVMVAPIMCEKGIMATNSIVRIRCNDKDLCHPPLKSALSRKYIKCSACNKFILKSTA